FFQAEDGIRDRNVTGVQTCALPISFCVGSFFAHSVGGSSGSLVSSTVCQAVSAAAGLLSLVAAGAAAAGEERRQFIIRRQTQTRSEERRVGKECRDGGGKWHERKKT